MFPPKAVDLFEEGRVLYEKNDYNGAIKEFTGSIENGFEGSKAYTLRGFSYFFINDLDSAISDFLRAVELDPKTNADAKLGIVVAYKTRANNMLKEGKAVESIEDLVAYGISLRDFVREGHVKKYDGIISLLENELRKTEKSKKPLMKLLEKIKEIK